MNKYILIGSAGLSPAPIPSTADLCRALTDDLCSHSGTTSTLWQGASASQLLPRQVEFWLSVMGSNHRPTA